MSYLYTDEQKQIREEVRRTLAGTSSLATLRSLLETQGAYDEGFWNTAREMGWTAMPFAEEEGGLGLSLIETLIVTEECGRVLAGAPFLASSFAAAHALQLAGDHGDIVKALAAGERTATLAFAEGSEVLPATIAARIADGRLTGEKSAVLGGARADLALVLALDEAGTPCLAVVDLASEGVSRQTFATIDNSRCIATLAFADAPATVLPVNDPRGIARECLGRLALYLASEGVGGTDACITLATDYANQRQAFGQAIGKFQAVKHAISEMYVANELARAAVLDAAVRVERGDQDAEAYIACARLNAVHGYDYAAAATTQVHGGIGVTWEADVHLHYRRARSLALEAGSPAFWEDRIVACLEVA